ncbi:MAG TPA: efflux RND transporter permease subunit [Bacteroidales bacterium]|nr:efflux RND transporter permease subunit [Bacteroidales bacterium]
MKITEIAVKNYQFTLVVFLLLIALGLYSLLTIPQSEDPEFDVPLVPVYAIYPGASPADMEKLVVDKIEKSLSELDDVIRLESTIKDGVSATVIEFASRTDPDKKFDEVSRQINTVRPSMPEGLYSLDVVKVSAGNTNIIQSALVSEAMSYADLKKYGEKIRDQIASIPGINKADVVACPEQELRIALDLPRLSQLKLSISQVIGAIQSENANIPGGSIEMGPRKFNIKTSGNYENISEVENTIVGSSQGQVVYLKDIARVEWNYEDLRYFGRYNGKKAVFLIASMKQMQNIHATRDLIYQKFDEFEKTLPAGVKLERGFDQAKNVSAKLGRLQFDFMFAILLVLLTLLPLGLRASGIVMISIPLSILIGLTGLYFTGYSINQLSIVGGVIALGLLVDDSIVVVENISRWIREGHKPFDAAIMATRQIGPAVLGCTATLIFAFLPLMFLPGMAGQYMMVLPVSVVYVIIGSLLVALTVIPFISSKVLKGDVDPHGNRVLQALNKGIDFTYARALQWSLQNPVKTVIMAAIIFIGSLYLIPVIGFSLFPKAGMKQFLITVETPKGSTIRETDKAVRFVESVVRNKPDITWYMSNIGKGNPTIYYNTFQKSEQNNLGELLCEMKPKSQPEITAFLDHLRDTLNTYVNARIYVYEFENGAPVEAPIAMRIVGDDLDTLQSLTNRIEKIMKTTNGTIYTKNPLSQSLTDLQINVNEGKAGIFGVPSVEIDRTIRLALAGIRAGYYREPDGTEHPINVRLPKGDANTLESLDYIYVSSLSGAQIPLSQLSVIDFEKSPTLIQHYDKERCATLSSFVQTGYNTDKVTREILGKISKLRLPAGYKIIPTGEIKSRQESFAGIGSAILVAIFGIFAILILEFRTFKGTLIVLSVIPLGVVGGILMLFLTGYTLSFSAAIGFVALIGIEIKNSILLVDFTNQLRQKGTPLDEAIIKAGEIRFLPVLLTTLTAIGGLLPIALSKSGIYSPLAWVIIGGLITSTLLARLVTPVMYKLIPPEVEF